MSSIGGGASKRAHDRDAVAFRNLLEKQRRQRMNEVSELRVRLHDARTALDRVDGEGFGFELQLLDERLAAACRGQAETEAALQRLADGSYGVCGMCRHMIARERLEILPEARLCTGCQSTRGRR